MFLIYLSVIIVIQTNILVINGQDLKTCDGNYCLAFGKCGETPKCKASDQKLYKNATICGCCDKCLEVLDEDEECLPTMSGTLPPTVCGPHLKCVKDNEKSVCKKFSDIKPTFPGEGKCEKDYVESNQHIAETPVPQCDDFGQYGPKQCRNGTLCHCVDTNGTRIFGSATYDKADDMDCLCSRQYKQVNDKLSQLNFTIDPVFFMRCKPNGNYEPFQINDNHTYCINTTEGIVKERAVFTKDMDQLSCKEDRYKSVSDCQNRYINVTTEIEKLEANGSLVIGYDIPKCDLDGTYAPVQCLNNFCFCVNKKGEKYRNTQIDRNSKLANDQRCNCVREMELIRDIPEESWDTVTDLFAQYRCERNGNYLELQCTESICYCVDPIYGDQVPDLKTPLKTNPGAILKLPCVRGYEEKYGDQYLNDQYPEVLLYS